MNDLRMFRALTAAGVVTVRGELYDADGRGRSIAQMERDVAQEAVRGQ